MAAPVRFELTHDAVRAHCLTTWLWGNKQQLNINIISFFLQLKKAVI